MAYTAKPIKESWMAAVLVSRLVPKFYHDREIRYRTGPQIFKNRAPSALLELIPTITAEQVVILAPFILHSVEFAVIGANVWLGIDESHFPVEWIPELQALVEAKLLIRQVGVPDDDSHDLHVVYFLHPRVIDFLVESSPASR